MQALQSYLQIEPDSGPDISFARGEQAAQAAIEELAGEARRQHGGWLKEKLVRAAARRIRLLMGARESPKFFAIRAMGIARSALLDVGKEFVEAGTLEQRRRPGLLAAFRAGIIISERAAGLEGAHRRAPPRLPARATPAAVAARAGQRRARFL